MRQKLALAALAALAAASSPGGPDDAEAALRNLLDVAASGLQQVEGSRDAGTTTAGAAAVGAAPWVRAATDLRDATPADVALAALGGAARRPERRPERRRTNAPKRPPAPAARPRLRPPPTRRSRGRRPRRHSHRP